MVGFGFGFGLFLAPRDPDRYMLDEARREVGFYVNDEGATGFVLHYVPSVSVDFSPFPWLRLQSSSELAWGPKVVSIAGAPEKARLYQFVRASELGLVNLELPVNEKRTVQGFFGAGAGVHHLDFEEHSVTTPGYRAQLGFGLLEKSVRVDGVVVFDYARARSKRDRSWLSGETSAFVLDYTSLHVDAVVHFNIVR